MFNSVMESLSSPRIIRFPTKMNRRSTLALVVFVLCCLLSSARLVVDAPRPKSLSDLASQIPNGSDRRFAALKAALPAQGTIGYVGEPGAPVDVLGNYYLTQYALAPLILENSPNHPLVVGNFPSSSPQTPDNLKLIRDFGNGVLLFAQKDNK
jgi:hypothetical protein